MALGAFGGAFLGMVCLQYFFDAEKEVHWLRALELQLAWMGKFEAAALGLMLLRPARLLAVAAAAARPRPSWSPGCSGWSPSSRWTPSAPPWGVEPGEHRGLQRAGAASFLYLEVLDASFSFDGVIGAFALTDNLFVIAIGLGIGAMFVRSLTVLLVEEGTLASFRYLEHGAFYAIGALAFLMMLGTVVDVPEAVTGLVGAAFIALALWDSVRYDRARRGAGGPPGP